MSTKGPQGVVPVSPMLNISNVMLSQSFPNKFHVYRPEQPIPIAGRRSTALRLPIIANAL